LDISTKLNNSQPSRLTVRASQSIDQALVVGLVVEDPLARTAPAHDMIDGARVLDSQRPAHSSHARKFHNFRVDIDQATGLPGRSRRNREVIELAILHVF